MPADLLFEIGCEEIPAKMLARALADLPGAVRTRLDAARLEHKSVKALGTPRRLTVIVKGLAERQPDLREEVVGPPVSAAFAPDGSLTKAGQGFAAKNGVDASQIAKKEVPGKKGLYAVAARHVVGGETRALLCDLLRDVAAGIPWPKAQRWGWSEVGFVRPVHWLVALYGGEVVPLTWAGQTAGRQSRGHRFLANTPVAIASADAYVSALRAAHVIVDPEARMTEVLAEIKRIEGETGLRVRPDDALLAEVIHLGEYPVGVSGSFDPAFLEVPEEMIVTAMRNHQRYFAMEDRAGKLANRFTTMMATVVKDPAVVRKGNETVLASRLSDARFFFGEDQKQVKAHGFAAWNRKLDAVVFQAKLGDHAKTIGQKVRRIVAIASALGGSATAVRIAELCKGDLASGAVGEFPELQGVMGKHYAAIAGDSAQVASGIEQHWWPKGQGAPLPESADAALVALADRVDTLVGCFATGLVPSGNADPLGLRRAAIGMLAILLARPAHTTDQLIDAAIAAYGTAVTLSPEARTQLDEFFRARLRGILVEESAIDPQAVDVALAVGAANPSDTLARAQALAAVPHDVRAVFKRIGNILDDARAKGFGTQPAPDPARFVSPVEGNLWSAWTSHAGELSAKSYRDALGVLATLGPALAAFFDKGGVMVMDPKSELRENRLALLHAIYDPFVKIGDFRKLGGAS
jgi:glycyl-tRNA synthetase beta chain